MTNSQVAQRFANGETLTSRGNTIEGSNMFIDGQTVFSYGYHFPIARLVGAHYAIFNSNGYSNSTAKHKNHVLSALLDADKIIIEAPQCALEDAEDYIKGMIAEAQAKQTRARSERMVEMWKDQEAKYSEMLTNYKNLIN